MVIYECVNNNFNIFQLLQWDKRKIFSSVSVQFMKICVWWHVKCNMGMFQKGIGVGRVVIDCQDMWGFDGSGLWVATMVTCTLMSCKDEEVVDDSVMDWRG